MVRLSLFSDNERVLGRHIRRVLPKVCHDGIGFGVFLMNAQCGARASSRRDRLNVAKLFHDHVTMIASRMSDLTGLRVLGKRRIALQGYSFYSLGTAVFIRVTHSCIGESWSLVAVGDFSCDKPEL